ncbi:hypothetical protein HBE96_04820 [Clostridium sp. P21]|uniref:Uncharacterized protein n=1 Tax=Clostridium muellerianum TaxID=2716538 RepID=A0A7Y0EEP7_9CLOT|nr:hypothetical protein [Clostridium muellerianum]NMM62023.1 hypothetical protein [Clostridium muellerianum]
MTIILSLEEVKIEFNFEVTEEDYVKFSLYHIENSPEHKRLYNMLRYFKVFKIESYNERLHV